jgi:hypothetical protein
MFEKDRAPEGVTYFIKNDEIGVRQGARRRIVIHMQRRATQHGGYLVIFYRRNW